MTPFMKKLIETDQFDVALKLLHDRMGSLRRFHIWLESARDYLGTIPDRGIPNADGLGDVSDAGRARDCLHNALYSKPLSTKSIGSLMTGSKP
jgi:hypothetical protein